MSNKTNIKITSKGIQKVLKKYNESNAFAEFIWNGFDAKATAVEINYDANELGFMSSLSIRDNGYGIPFEKLKEKFEPFFESEKIIEIESPKNTSLVHGKNGVGRLTFFTFSNIAQWKTIYKKENKFYCYKIKIDSSSLNSYESSEKDITEIKSKHTGTEVIFSNIRITSDKIQEEIKAFLITEFGWFLELNKSKNYEIKINGETLAYSSLIGEKEDTTILHKETKTSFSIHYVRWAQKLNKEFSKYYYLDSTSTERFKEFTLLNNKGDHFYHSVYIQSNYFDEFNFTDSSATKQISLVGGNRIDDEFDFLHDKLVDYLRKKRRPFLKIYSDTVITEYESEGVFPIFKKDAWDQIRKAELHEIIKGLYEVEPKLFSNLNLEQKKTFVGFLNLLLDTGEREQLFKIMQEIVDLDSEERKDLALLLKSASLSNVIKTLKLIEDRFATYYQIKELAFNKKLNADEVHHLQKIVELHYWIFGEQYNLVTAAEPKFEEALRRFTYILKGTSKKKSITHVDKNKEMDIFMCRQELFINKTKCVVVELKHPKKKLGKNEVDQVKKYMDVITKEQEFNANNISWDFILVGNEFDSTDYINKELGNTKHWGEDSLIFKNAGENNRGEYKIYVKKWSEIFNEFECRHKFIDEKLKIQRLKLMKEYDNAGQVIEQSKLSSAARSPILIK